MVPSSIPKSGYELLCWNVNGLRALIAREGKQKQPSDVYVLSDLLHQLNADIFCFQETKLTSSELDASLARPSGFDAYYSFSRVKGGYSGVVTYCRNEENKDSFIPVVAAEEGLMGLMQRTSESQEVPITEYGDWVNEISSRNKKQIESEGRCIVTDHGTFVLLNVYCPALCSPERLDYKLLFHQVLQHRIDDFKRAGRRVILVGDLNICHREIDHCDPMNASGKDDGFDNHPCRQWMSNLLAPIQAEEKASSTTLDDAQLIDCFRYFYPEKQNVFTCWSTVTGARQTNFGQRIDYIVASKSLMHEQITDCSIHSEIMGSDHCPIKIQLSTDMFHGRNTNALPTKAPSLCSKYMKSFSGTQQNLSTFFLPSKADSEIDAVAPVKPPFKLLQSNSESSLPSAKRRRVSSSQQRSMRSFFTPKTSLPHKTTISSECLDMSTIDVEEQKALWRTLTKKKKSLDVAGTMATAWSPSHDGEFLNQHIEKEEDLAVMAWRSLLRGKPPEPPMCIQHNLPCVLRTIQKVTNKNWGKKFYVCSQPEGHSSDLNARCNYFQWADHHGRPLASKKTSDVPSSVDQVNR